MLDRDPNHGSNFSIYSPFPAIIYLEDSESLYTKTSSLDTSVTP